MFNASPRGLASSEQRQRGLTHLALWKQAWRGGGMVETDPKEQQQQQLCSHIGLRNNIIQASSHVIDVPALHFTSINENSLLKPEVINSSFQLPPSVLLLQLLILFSMLKTAQLYFTPSVLLT